LGAVKQPGNDRKEIKEERGKEEKIETCIAAGKAWPIMAKNCAGCMPCI